LAALAFLVGTAVGCSNGSKGASGRGTTTTEAPTPIAFTITSFDVEAVADPVAGTVDSARAGVEATFKRWLEEDVLPPLRSAQPAGDLRTLFTAVTGERVATTPDRAAFVTEGLPPVSGLKADRADLAATALANADGQIAIVTVHLDLKLQGKAESTPLTVEHTGDLALVPEGDGWKIDGYDVRTTRDTPDSTTTTTAKA
jgi:hypothetical protein